MAALLSVVALALVAVGYGAYQNRRPRQAPPTPIPVTLKVRRSVAVLGFQNLTGRSDAGWLSTALSEMFTTELAAGEQVRTVSEEEVAQMRAGLPLTGAGTLSKDTLARIHQNLGADLVVLGSYTDLGKKSGSQVRLDLQAAGHSQWRDHSHSLGKRHGRKHLSAGLPGGGAASRTA